MVTVAAEHILSSRRENKEFIYCFSFSHRRAMGAHGADLVPPHEACESGHHAVHLILRVYHNLVVTSNKTRKPHKIAYTFF